MSKKQHELCRFRGKNTEISTYAGMIDLRYSTKMIFSRGARKWQKAKTAVAKIEVSTNNYIFMNIYQRKNKLDTL